MTDTLFDLTYRVCSKLGMVREGAATGGSGTTIIDTVERGEEDDYWIGGTAWLLRNANDVGVSPERKYSVITAFVNSTGVITLRDTFTDNVEVGDRYAVGKVRYPLWLLIQKINEAVEGMGDYPVTDKATITIVASQTEYSIPSVANRNLVRVSVQTKKDTNDYRWVKVHGWNVERTAIGTADLLILSSQLSKGYLLKLEYGDVHDQLYVSTDQLSETVHILRVVTLAAIKCLLHRKQKIGSNDPTLNEQLNMFLNELQMWEIEEPIIEPDPETHLFILRGLGQ